jgi:hypothetical protein
MTDMATPRKIAALAFLVVIGNAGALGVTTAAAQTNTPAFGSAICIGTQNQTYSPALTATTQDVSFTARTVLSSCPTTSDQSITNGSFTINGSGPLSCVDGGSVISQLTLAWNNGETSTVVLFSPLDLKPDGVTAVVSYGSVISGKFYALPVAEVLLLTPTPLLGCETTGITSSSGPVVFAIGLPATDAISKLLPLL